MPPAGTDSAFLTMILLDYVLAFGVLGLSALFRGNGSKKRVIMTVIIVCFLRYLFSTISGVIIWGPLMESQSAAISFSAVYNAKYMVPETGLTLVAALFLKSSFPTIFCRQKGLIIEEEEESL